MAWIGKKPNSLPVGKAAIIIDSGVLRIYFNDFIVISDGLCEIMLLGVSIAAAVISLRILGIYFNRLSKIRNSLW